MLLPLLTVCFAPQGVFARRVARARAKRAALRAAPLPRRVTRLHAKSDDAKSRSDDDDTSSKNKDVAAGEGLENADDWIANWKAGNFPRAKGWKFGDASSEGTGTFSEEVSGGGEEGEGADEDSDETNLANQYGGNPNAYTYVFCHNLMSPPGDSFACMYLTDTLGSLNIPLVTPSLISDGGADESDGSKTPLTITAAVARLTKAIDALPDDKPIRLIGSSLGAYVLAVYASIPENSKKIDRVMLLAPTFKPADCLESIETEMGIEMGDAFREDLKYHEPFPFVPCRAYVVHGYDDTASPLENSLTWVRDASVNMRQGSGESGQVAERRLLEVAGMGHGVENALPQIKSRLVDFFKLPFQVQGP